MEFDTDIIIAGAGLNGALLALALAEAGLMTTVVEPISQQVRQTPSFDGRAYALALTSTRLLQGLNLWEQLDDRAQPMLDIKVTDGRPGEGPSPFFMHFDHREVEEGPMGFMVEDRHLRPVLLQALENTPNIRQITGETVTVQDPNHTGINATLSSSATLNCRLLIGCDGRGSATAARAGLRRSGWSYDQTALVCAVEHDLPHAGIAHQFFMPAGPLAILPLSGNRSSIVWSESTNRAAEINSLSDPDYLDILRPRFGNFLGDISLAGDRFTYPLSLSLVDRLIAERVALVGDAAHGIHPIAGQGLNAGMRDIAALAEVLADAHRRGEDIGSPVVLERYQQWRRFDNASLALATDAFNRLFSNDNPLLRLGRDLGMGLVNNMPALRRGLIREAAGLTGELPRLMRGLPL